MAEIEERRATAARGGFPPREYRPYSRVVEINPTRGEIVWQFWAQSCGLPLTSFFNDFTGNARRLPNGNTMISESSWGRMIFEVNRRGEIVWKWLSPYVNADASHFRRVIPRCYRVDPTGPTGLF